MTEPQRIERFEAAYNRIDRALADLVSGGDRRKHGFAARVRIAANRRRHLARFKDFLLEAGELRNAIVHNRVGDDEYLAVPSEATVLELERIETLAFSPEKVLPRFARKVMLLHLHQTLAEVWALMRSDGYSRYPVYERNSAGGGDGNASPSTFIGLLTSNGVARWCAGQADANGLLHVDGAQARVGDVLGEDHRRDAVRFVSRDALVADVDEMFRELHTLEAVIITDHGRPEQPPLGMICAPDIATV